MNEPMAHDKLHYLVTRSGQKIIAHCLEYDLVTSADTYHEAMRRLTFVVLAHVATASRQGIPAALSHRAPEPYWRKYQHFLESETEASLERSTIPGTPTQVEALVATAVH